MRKIRLGKTGLMISELGFGGIPIQRLDDDEAVRVVWRCPYELAIRETLRDNIAWHHQQMALYRGR